MVECSSVAAKNGYKYDVYIWNKPDKVGKSHQGGARQATASEFIVVVYKHENTGGLTLAKHYALLAQKDDLEKKIESQQVRKTSAISFSNIVGAC
jgi:hypothetical protein